MGGSPWQVHEVLSPAGTLTGAVCPNDVPSGTLALLHPQERQFARGRSGDALRQWVAGRHCLAAALRAHAVAAAVLPGPNGRPVVPPGIAASISHKRSVSVAIATTVFQGVGIDIEHVDDGDKALVVKVLTKAERDSLERVAEISSTSVTIHFAVKEAVYKAAPDSEQEDLEFEDIVIAPESELLSERVWVSVLTTVPRSESEYRACIFRFGRWVLAVATRS